MKKKIFEGWFTFVGIIAIYPYLFLCFDLYDYLELKYNIESLPFNLNQFIGLNLFFFGVIVLCFFLYPFLLWFFYEKNRKIDIKELFLFFYSLFKGLIYINGFVAFIMIVMYVFISIIYDYF
tara:strand:+ start:181 stop:546 length:366 start_codon:yes stop_codon:yes gene_type:complete